jgi:hypothetical protein
LKCTPSEIGNAHELPDSPSILPMPRLHPFLILATLAFSGKPLADEVKFRSEILPLLSENCFNCHGPDAGTRKAGLRLDLRDAAMMPAESGKSAIVPGDPDASELIARILSKDPDEVMPPPESKKSLPPHAAATLRNWIQQGAVYQKHWAFDPIQRPAPPATRAPEWARNPIDRFILARLEHEKIQPSPEAPKHVQLRRLSLDLTGLPPAPEEIAAFLADNAPDAYERAVDRLLASPRYGERMALPWLDAARYADSNGFQQDGDNHQYVWRDWVVRALNANMPFDQFALEQLAGDLLPSPTTDQLVATGFNRNHLLNGEGGAIPEEQRNVILFDRVDVTATTFLGLTMACAQCHDHKYDPLPQRDYYRMMAFFNQVPESGVPPGGGQYRIADPWIHAGSPDEMAELAKLEAAAKSAAEIRPEITAAQAAWETSLANQSAPVWQHVRPLSASADHGVTLEIADDPSIFASGARPDNGTYVIQLPASEGAVTGLRIETLPDERLPAKGAGLSDSGNAVLTRVRLSAGGTEIQLASAAADYSQGGFSPEGVLHDDPSKAWAFHPDVTRSHFLIVQPAGPVAAGQPMTLTLEFRSVHKQHLLGRFRISNTSAPDPARNRQLPPAVLTALAKPAPSRNAAENQAVFDHFLAKATDPLVVDFRKTKESTAAAAAKLRDSLPKVMVMSDARPRKTHIFDRGSYTSPLEEVQPDTPECLPPMPAGAPKNRLGLARWLVSPENPLTARVQVNRYWQLFFGHGLVKSSENLGVQADPPTHPELLDWLAAEFRESGWNVKHLHRLIVTSATYRQSAKTTPALLEIDPENKLLARAPRFRLPSPLLRDLALASGGLLDLRSGGKPVYPYQPNGIWDGLSITKERDFTYPQSTGADLYRRSLYTFWRRTVAPGNMFDSSSRSLCSVKPSLTNTPIHALTTLNDITWIEAARALAATAIREAGPDDPAAQISHAFLRVCSRHPGQRELEILQRSFNNARATFDADPAAAEAYLSHGESARESPVSKSRFAALAAVCLSILNLDEALSRG